VTRGQTITYKARADNTMAKSKKTRGQTIAYKARADNTTAKSKKTRGQTITYKARADNTMVVCPLVFLLLAIVLSARAL
jgi:hypothetical protein